MNRQELQQQISALLTWERVRAWAEQQPAQCFVGKPGTSHACPLACYLNEQQELPAEIQVGLVAVGPAGGAIANLPRWAVPVVLAVDGQESDEVLREQFIEILDKCKPEEHHP